MMLRPEARHAVAAGQAVRVMDGGAPETRPRARFDPERYSPEHACVRPAHGRHSRCDENAVMLGNGWVFVHKL